MDDPKLLRARRRYRALLRETNILQGRGQTDETLMIELQKLESDYPSLKEIVGPALVGETRVDTDGLVKKDTTTNTVESSPGPSVDLIAAVLPTDEKGKEATTSRLVPLSGPHADEGKHTDGVSEGRKTSQSPPLRGGAAFFFCALSIWSEAHLPTSFGIHSYNMITFLTILVAVLHRYVIDSGSLVGKIVSPVLLDCLVHLKGLIAIHLKRPERISGAMLLVYFFCDLLPSMVFVFVVYTLTTISLELLE